MTGKRTLIFHAQHGLSCATLDGFERTPNKFAMQIPADRHTGSSPAIYRIEGKDTADQLRWSTFLKFIVPAAPSGNAGRAIFQCISEANCNTGCRDGAESAQLDDAEAHAPNAALLASQREIPLFINDGASMEAAGA